MFTSPPPDRNPVIRHRRLKASVVPWLPMLAVTAGLVLTFAPWPGHAQPSPLGEPGAQVEQTDPPSRVATLTEAKGNLSFAPAGSDEWAAAGLNRPITTGDRLWVDNGGRAEMHAGAVAIRLGSATAVSVLNLDDNATQVKLTQGTLQLRVRALPPDQPVEIDTPNLAFVPSEPGDYRLDVSPDGSITTVTMRHGHAAIYGDNRSLEMSRGERMSFAGTDLADAGPGNLPPEDDFDRWTASRDAREDASPTARYVPRDMPGYAALDGYGDWQEDAGYGAVWFPRAVDTGWAPYSTGHWAWVAPWGWTWIDDEPWGFAPFHYGRWAYIGNRWGWVPGPRVPRPCYAPALVGFVGAAGPNWSVRVGGGPGVAWYPLGPRDAYRPVYRASPAYVTRINRVNVNNIAIDNRFRGDQRPNRDVPGAIRGMPARNFVEGRPVPRNMRANEWRNLPQGEARGAPPVAPVKGSLLGAAPARQLPPQARQGFDRQAIAARPPGQPAHDDLARRFAREGGVVSGAGPVWRGGDTRPRGMDAHGAPNVRMSQAAVSARPGMPPQRHDDDAGRRPPAGGERGAPAMSGGDPWRGNGRGFTTRPDQVQGLVQMPDAQRQGQELQRQQQQVMRQQMEQQRQQQEQQRQGADSRRQQQPAQDRQQWEQQRQGHEAQDQAQAMQRQQQQGMQRQQMDQQRQMQDQQRQQSEQRHMMESQRQQADQQRQQADQQRQQSEQRHMMESQRQQADQQRQQADQQRQQSEQRHMMESQRQQADQQRQQADQQRQQSEQRHMLESQRQQADQQRQMADQQRQQQAAQRQQMDQQRQQQEQQRQMADQQRQQQAAQRQQMEQQRQQQEQQRQMADQQRQQQAVQRQQMEQQRQQQEQQRQMADQQRQVQEQQRRAQDQQRAAQEQQRAMQEQQRAMQEQQRHQQDQQRQMQERQRQQQQQQQQQMDQQRQQQRAHHDRGQMEARNGQRDGDGR
ncbi:hypothetical protein LMG31506_04607 [Cupriavidus yeoncheonensis]|uniref:Uncharacterized protein n=1 Tax=Cupriavidus yeoncheonensis TaxID=1462994 RepID=A0A916MX13_9BURK|nr:DUF6600 domain-containing protein [Cupriavidus yeoncheonensis]CAG2152402.1 hypothetical protein LMG31506_04607 [Cupriavidus yeoncheonensis]